MALEIFVGVSLLSCHQINFVKEKSKDNCKFYWLLSGLDSLSLAVMPRSRMLIFKEKLGFLFGRHNLLTSIFFLRLVFLFTKLRIVNDGNFESSIHT